MTEPPLVRALEPDDFALLDRFVRGGEELRAITRVATLIDLGQADIREFFVGAGFRTGPMVQLERVPA